MHAKLLEKLEQKERAAEIRATIERIEGKLP